MVAASCTASLTFLDSLNMLQLRHDYSYPLIVLGEDQTVPYPHGFNPCIIVNGRAHPSASLRTRRPAPLQILSCLRRGRLLYPACPEHSEGSLPKGMPAQGFNSCVIINERAPACSSLYLARTGPVKLVGPPHN